MSTTELFDAIEAVDNVEDLDIQQMVEYMKVLIHAAGEEFRKLHTRVLDGEEISNEDVQYLLEAFAILLCSTSFSEFVSGEHPTDNPLHFYHEILKRSEELLDP